MKYNILVGNNIHNIGAKVAKNLSNFGFQTDTCSNSFNELAEKLENKHYDAFFFFILSVNKDYYKYISEVRKNYSYLKIYPAIFTVSEAIIQDLCDLGANKCIIMPSTDFEICCEIVSDFFHAPNMELFSDIYYFLQEKRFNRNTLGFYLLCTAIMIHLTEADAVNYPMMTLYEKVAERMNTSNENVERSLRNHLSRSFEKGVILDGAVVHRRMKNKDLILHLVNEFKKQNGYTDK